MTQNLQQQLEERFHEYRLRFTKEQWTSSSFLFDEVKNIETDDIALAYRLMKRVKNLEPSDANQDYLKALQNKALHEYPQLATVSSTEFSTIVVKKGRGLLQRTKSTLSNSNLRKYGKPFILVVWVPFFIFSFYQILIASPRFESQAKTIIKEPNGMATLDPTMALMSGFGVGSAGSDTELVKAFIQSNNMLDYLEQKISISQHYSDPEFDFFSRLSSYASSEDKLEYYLKRIKVEVNEKSQVISIYAQAFDPEYSIKLNQSIVERAEWYINEIGHNLSKAQLEFVQQEHELVNQKLKIAKSELLSFQQRYDLLDPVAESMAMQQITFKLEGEIASKRAQLSALRSSMSSNAPMVMQTNAELDSLLQQLNSQRGRLTDKRMQKSTDTNVSPNLSVGQILASYSNLQINLELALQAYTSSQISLEKSRIEAYRQLKFLVVVESATLPDDASYPKLIYNNILFLCVLLMLFAIGKIILATVKELR
jgi:capsular polysaccharide transport system permease protein